MSMKNRGVRLRRHAVALLALAVCQTIGCAQEATYAVSLKPMVIVVKPQIRFEDVRGFFIPSVPTTESYYRQILIDTARGAVGTSAGVAEPDKLDPDLRAACGLLESLTSRLARGDTNEEARAVLTRMAAAPRPYLVLVQFLRIRTGPGASWNPNTGAIASSLASTLFQSALISPGKGSTLWKGEQLVRNKALTPTDAGFRKALTKLYKDFEIIQETGK